MNPVTGDSVSVMWNESRIALASTLSFDTPTREANARLIAAAPDLLEALEEILGHNYIAFVEEGPISDDEWKRAKAAIAKAKGEA